MEGVRIGRVVWWSGCSTIPCQCRAWGKIRCRGWGGMARHGEEWGGEERGCSVRRIREGLNAQKPPGHGGSKGGGLAAIPAHDL